MGYISKGLLLKVYTTLSNLTEDHKQGQTQIVSFIRHFVALDMFYKKHNQNCDLNEIQNRNEFTENVKKIVGIENNGYIVNFYDSIKTLPDCGVGSNFFSAGVVNNSRQNTNNLYEYPTRGQNPLFNVKANVLIRNIDFYSNIDAYLTTNFKSAFVLWLLRDFSLETFEKNELRRTLSLFVTDEMLNVLIPNDLIIENYVDGFPLVDEKANLTSDDLLPLFHKKSTKENLPLQQIYYGTPGSGKSHKVKDMVEAAYPDKDEREKYVFRTTFHPDSDYASFVGCYKPQMKDGAITYEFVPQSFTKAYVQAWNEPEKQIYLIVEEINRGNCAQIFGDLFQLLDRKSGVSEYPIDADDDLRQYLAKELNEAGKAGIANGKIKLPANLNILATMNTSDQSLFPMDSAFKRRWNWECVPIDYNNPDSGVFTISLGDKEYNWHEFLKKINELIRKATDSEDKQMGNFFIDGDVDESQFVNKVMFYLWNDVCKEEFGTKNNFFRYYADSNKTEKEFSFNDLFGTDAHNILVKFMVHIGFKDDGEQQNNKESEPDGE